MITKTERNLLFNSTELVEIPAEKWDSLWSSVDNVWRVESKRKKEWKLLCKLKKEYNTPKRRRTVLKSNICSASATVRFERSGTVQFQIHSVHCHTVDLADSLRRSTYILDFAKEEIKRGYDSQAVMSLVKKMCISHDYLGFKYLPLSYLRTLQNKSPGNEELEQNSVGSVLLSNQYQMFSVSLPSGRAFAFLHPKQLDLLRLYGNGVVVMDSKEKTNSKKYHYATAVIRTDERKWMPAFQFWISNEHSELYSACLKWILEKSGSSWKPACFVIDGSRMEEKAVVAVFGDSTKVFDCTRHSLETLKSRLGHSAVELEGMKRALFASSYRECLSSLQFAVDSCPYEELKRYIQRAWPMERSHIWSLHARREGQMGEVTTTNPVESFFLRVKKVVNVKMSLQESTGEIVKLLHGMFEKMTEIKEKELVTCIVGVEKIHTSVSSWTLSNQKLILKEFEAAQKYVSEGTFDFLYIQAKQDGTCKCRFYRFNQMPCSHILGRHIASNGGFITDAQWNLLKERFQ